MDTVFPKPIGNKSAGLPSAVSKTPLSRENGAQAQISSLSSDPGAGTQGHSYSEKPSE